ncbi:hypothetical protein [Providencia sneebia]|uniref:hypothetical protein n=1 Tax=Providencia sneebia TaxID=516075 RepID=UPI001F1C76E7|nr:hypothetical protein [Providencia sneebia]
MQVKKEIRNSICQLTEKNSTKPVIMVSDVEFNMVKSFMQQVVSSLIICSYNDISNNELVDDAEMLQVNLAYS